MPKKPPTDPHKPACGCDAVTAGQMARSEGRPRKAPEWLQAHNAAYRREWVKGWDRMDRQKKARYGDTGPNHSGEEQKQ